MNLRSQPLQKHEIEAMRADKDIQSRLQVSYRIMLDFYGMQLKSPETGLLVRSEPDEKWEDRYGNLERAWPHPPAALQSVLLTTGTNR